MPEPHKPGVLYLIPNALGAGALHTVLPAQTSVIAARLDCFIGENAKSTRAFLNRVGEVTPLHHALQDIAICELRVGTHRDELPRMLEPIVAGRDAGLVSEAGCPAIADPGAELVRLAHLRGVPVRPLVGPSAILLALMASGLDGQRFAFNGYLPIDSARRVRAIRDCERRSANERQTQIFIETPYRNRVLLSALAETCAPATSICVATDLTLETESIATRPARAWRGSKIDLEKRPTVFLLLASPVS